MLTTSHAYWTWRVARGRAGAAAAVLGAAAPDAPGIALAAIGLARGRRGAALLRHVYQRPGPARVHALAHSALVPAGLALLARGRPGRTGGAARALAAGWMGHLAVDVATHHDDAWAPLHPLSRWRLRSPVSYWQPSHHARAYSVLECLALALAARAERGAIGRVAALGALAPAALALARRRMWVAHACATATADPQASPPRSPARGATVTR